MLHELSGTRSPEETRNRILAATRSILSKKGRRGTTTREVADLAGVNEATLFRHFGSKDALLEACVQHYCQATLLEERLGSLSGDVEPDLRLIANELMERMMGIRDLIVVSLAEEESDSSMGTATWRAPSAIHRIVTEYMARRVESGRLHGDPQLLARFFMGMIFARVIGAKKFQDDGLTSAEVVDFCVNVFLNGVRKKN